MAFNATGSRLAVGDCGGRVVLFDTAEGASYHSEFQSHEADLDVCTSTEIAPTITSMHWCPWGILTANQRTVKLWSVRGSTSKLRRTYSGAHRYAVHSVSANSDGATMLSADDLRINMWPIDAPSTQAFTILDSKPEDISTLDEVITTASFHPRQCNEMLWATSAGNIVVADTRIGPVMRPSAGKRFGSAIRRRSSSSSSFDMYDDVTSAVTGAAFAGADGVRIISRDYINLSVWDVRKETRPVNVWPIHRQLRDHFESLYKTEALFDKFSCATSMSGRHIVTGTYAHSFFIVDANNPKAEEVIERASRDTTVPHGMIGFRQPSLHLAMHPTMPSVAVAAKYSLYVFKGFV